MQSPGSPSESPLWPPPKAPLPPQRLANIANALGIPTPAFNPFTRSPSEPGSLPHRASPIPSVTTSIPSSSKYLLHVIPPSSLYHGSGKRDHRPPPPSANGYHPHFHRGVLVPICANFQTQLSLIAKEYALPSTTGMLLYLVTSLNDPPDAISEELVNEPGPLLSEEIWKHLWTRVVKAEQMENSILSQSPQMYRLGSQSGVDSNFSLSQGNGDPALQLRPLLSTGTSRSRSVASSFTPSSSMSSRSDLRLNSKSPFLTSPSDPGTPDTSHSSADEAGIRADRLVLPGLRSTSLVPVLAKVAFDIDRRRAGWLEPWLRSRRVNHAKRFGAKRDVFPEAPLALVIGTKDSINAGYTPPSDDSESDAENATARVSLCAAENGPLEDAFGTGACTAAEARGRQSNGNEGGEKPLNETSHLQLSIVAPQETLKDSLHGVNGSDDEIDVYTRVRSPEESEKRVCAIFDDLDLGLDPSLDFDDNDPYDKRRSQFLMKAKLDEIEKAMLQCSPRTLKTSLVKDSSVAQQSPSKSTYLTVSPLRNGGVRTAQLHHNDDSEITVATGQSTPHNPSRKSASPVKKDDSVAPLRPTTDSIATAGNGTKPFSPPAQDTKVPEDYQTMVVETGGTIVTESPIPLSPDPFGRFPSTVAEEFSSAEITKGGITSRIRSPTTTAVSSRFSVDSKDDVISKSSNRATLISVKNIKKFWRRSDKSTQSNNQLLAAQSTGTSSPNQFHPGPDRPSQGGLLTPIVTSSLNIGSAALGRASMDQLSVPSSTAPSRSPSPNSAGPSHLEGLHFDQDSPYPTRFPPRYSPRSTSPPFLPPFEPQKTIRKSKILKWATKSRNGSVSQGASATEPRASLDQSRPPSRSGIIEGLRARQPSIVGLVFKHVSTLSSDVPPSPMIPEQFLVNNRHAVPSPTTLPVDPQGKHQPTSNTNQPRSSMDSHASSERQMSSPSMTSSQDSLYTRPSFDTSQFEIVSPKASALTYPYHGLDHD